MTNEELQRVTDAVNCCRQKDDPLALALGLKRLGHLERQSGLNGAATAHYQEAVDIFRTMGDISALAHTIRHLGDVHLEAGQFESAESCYQEALSFYRHYEGSPPLDLANAIRSVALLKGEIGAKEDAKSLWSEARALYLQLGVNEGVAECDHWLSELK